MSDIIPDTPLTELSDLNLTTVALTEIGRRRDRAWAEVIGRARPAVRGINPRGTDRQELIAQGEALIYEALVSPVHDIVRFARSALDGSNVRRELAADAARRGMTGVGQRRAIAAQRIVRDVALLGASAELVWEQEGPAAPNRDSLTIADAEAIAVLGSPASLEAMTAGADFEPAVAPLTTSSAGIARSFTEREQAALDAFQELSESEKAVVTARWGLDGSESVESTSSLAEVTSLTPREVKTKLQSAKRRLMRAAA